MMPLGNRGKMDDPATIVMALGPILPNGSAGRFSWYCRQGYLLSAG